MAITTFAELKTAIANWLERSDLTSRIPEFVSMAEDRIGLDLRIRPMETSSDITINAQTEALPTRFLGVRRFTLDNDASMLTYFTPEKFWNLIDARTEGKPKAYTIEGENFVFAPYPNGETYTGKLYYWQKFASLSADADTNWVLTNARGLLLYGSLFEAATYLEDDEAAARWARLYNDTLGRVKKSDSLDRHPSGATMQSSVWKI